MSLVSLDEAYYPKIPPINVELTSHCNLKCPYCVNPTLARDYEAMDDELISRLIEQCQSFNLQIAAVHGVGEPLLRKNLEAILTRFREAGIWKGHLATNGTLLSLERMKLLYEAGVNPLFISLDTLDANLYERTRGGQLHKTIENVKAAASAFPDVQFCVGLMNHKEQTITPETECLFKETFANLPNVNFWVYNNLLLPGAAEDWRRERLTQDETCINPRNYLTIDARGLFSLCCADQNTEHVLGDLRRQTIHEVWYSQKNQETFRNIALGVKGCPDVCFKCVLKPTSKEIENIEPILYAPMSQLLAKAEEYFLDGNFHQSQYLYEHALTRDPDNQYLKYLVNKINIPLDWTNPEFIFPHKAYFPTIPPINIELSSHCNLKCPYCANATLARDYEKMEDELIDRVIEQCQLLKLQILGVHGVGEPLLRKDLEAILTRFREAGIWKGHLTTNGTLLSLERMKSLHEAGVIFIYNSLDTLDANLYKRTRGGEIHKTIENIKAAASNFPDVQFLVGLMNHKEQTITPETECLFKDTFAGLPNIRLGIYENGRFPGAAEDWRREVSSQGSETCVNPANFLTIDAKGLIALCCADQNTEHVLGDLRQQTIHEVWYSKKNQETFRNIALGVKGCPDVCFKCILKPTSKEIENIEPILYAPMSQLLTKAEECFLDGNFHQSQYLYEHALTRDPYSQYLKYKVDNLTKKTGVLTNNYFQEYRQQGGIQV